MVDYFEVINEQKIGVFHQQIQNKAVCQKIAEIKNQKNEDDPFLVLNLSFLIEKYIQWKRELPRVKPFYAVKCNDDPVILSTLGSLGSGFDCASKNEINKVLQLKVTGPEGIIYANPCKTKNFIIHADEWGVKKMTFDNAEELAKVKQLHTDPE